MNSSFKTLVRRTAAVGLCVAGLAGLLAPLRAWALESTKIGAPALIDSANLATLYPPAQDVNHTNSTGATGYPNEIIELAKALNNNPDEIYDFVRNYVDTVFIFGAQKGALGAIVDKSGTPFDQAELMVSLLKQAGYTTATYQFGTITLSGAQFQAWTGISNAQSACNLLASGGVPASVNGSTGNLMCSSFSSSTALSTVTLAHIWVSVTIGGGTYVFDPSYKPYNWRTSANLGSAAGLTSGAPLSAVTSGATVSTNGSVGYVQSLNASGLYTSLTSYAGNLQSYIQNQSGNGVPLASGQIKDLVGGGDIQRYTGGQQRITSLTYAAASPRQWTAVPDQFRASLRVQLNRLVAPGQQGLIIDKLLYADDIYGRKLNFTAAFSARSNTGFQGTLELDDEFGVSTPLATYTLAANGGSSTTPYSQGNLTLTVNHPYAADASGTGSGGTYMDTVVTKNVIYVTPFTIVHGWGDENRGLIDKWSSRPNTVLPAMAPQGCEDTCASDYPASEGDARREQYAASFLVQASKAARLHAAIANATYTHHHTIGIAYGDSALNVFVAAGSPAPPNTIYAYSVGDNLDAIDVETGFSLTSNVGDAVARRAAIQAIASTQAALEGSTLSQIADVPDNDSVARRFEWGNAPPSGEDPSGAGARPFYEFNATNGSDATNQVQPLLTVEGSTSTSNTGVHNGADPIIGSLEYSQRRVTSATVISQYASAGFTVIASGDTFLGPGQRGGMFIKQAGTPIQYSHSASFQRGGAMVATRYDANGVDPLEIAHVILNADTYIKGGGAGVQPNHEAQYDPATAADVLKARFVDRSDQLGVSLQTGSVTYPVPASLTVGSGGFPYELTGQFLWLGGNVPETAFGPRSDVEPMAPWTTNWNNTLALSGSGLEAMGETDIRASAGTVAAFLAMQDVYKQPVSRQREVAAVLVASWWVAQLNGNVATVQVGNSTRQFLRKYDKTWFAPGPGEYATLTQTGQRVPYAEPSCVATPVSYVLTRGWDASAVSFTVTNAHGDVQSFPYWTNLWDLADGSCARLHGFRLANWTFPQGVTVSLVYQSPGSGQLDQLVEVNNSLGRKIDFTTTYGTNTVQTLSNGLTGSDARSLVFTLPLGGAAGTATITDPAGAATRMDTEILGMRYQIDNVYLADNSSSTASIHYTYDSMHRASQYQDQEAMLGHDRNPYTFLIAEGARGDRIDPLGGVYTVIFDTYRRPLAFMDELARTTTVIPDGRGRMTAYIYPDTDQETLAYDDHNNVTQLGKVRKTGSTTTPIGSINASYDQTWNKLAWIKDALGNQTDFSYYPSGAGISLLHQATRPAVPDPNGVMTRPVYTYAYDSAGKLLSVTDPTNLVVSNHYQAGTEDLLNSAVDPTGINSVTSFTYYANGDVATVTDPRSNVAEFQYDLDRRKTVTLHHNGAVTAALIAAERTTYDIVGRETKQEGGTAFFGTTVSTWQQLSGTSYTLTGKILTKSDGAGDPTTFHYDGDDRAIVVTDPENRNVGTFYDAAGQVSCLWRGWSSATTAPMSCTWNPATYTGIEPVRYAAYTYSPDGLQLSALDADNNLTTNVYDGFNRLSEHHFPVPAAGAATSSSTDLEQYTYYDDGTVKNKILRDGQTIAYSYDNLRRLTVKDLPVTTTGDVYYGYDLAGRISFARFGSVSGSGVSYGYDSAKRLTSESTFGRTLSFGLDAAGNRISLSWPDGNCLSNSNCVNFDVDALNRAWQIRENNATSGTGVLVTYTYDPLSRTQSVSRGNGTSTGYGFDLASRVNALNTDLAGSAQDISLTFTYTNASQLKTRTNSNSIYDWVVPTSATTYVADGLNRYSSVGGTSYTYDARGNLTSDGTRTFTYDEENHLLTESGATALTLSYDPLGRLSQTVSGSTTTQFLYDGERLVAEYDGNGSVVRRYVHGPGTDTPVVWYEGSTLASRNWLHTDEHGSIVATSDGSGGGTVYTYDPYGTPNNWTGSRFRYTGQIALPEAHLYHYKTRVYDPTLGRFLQTDSVGDKDDLNLYAYTHDDPEDGRDPTGEFDVDFFNHGYAGDQAILAMVGDAHIPGTFFVGSHGNNGGLMRSPALTTKEHDDYHTWSFIKDEDVLAKYPGNKLPIILYSCQGSAREAESLARATGAVVYAAVDFTFPRELKPGVVEVFSATEHKDRTPDQRSGFVAVGDGPRPFGDMITSVVFNRNKGTATVNWEVMKTGSRIPETHSTTLCNDKTKCGN